MKKLTREYVHVGVFEAPAKKMNQIDDDPVSKVQQEEAALLHDFIEHNWFFHNLFNKKGTTNMMFRSYSDPSPSKLQPPSQSLSRAPSLPLPLPPRLEEGSTNVVVVVVKEKADQRKLCRQSSLQINQPQQLLCTKKNERVHCRKGRNFSKHGCLLRAPSLPPNFGRDMLIEEDEDEEEESEFRMSNLIQQALPNINIHNTLPKRHHHTIKVMKDSLDMDSRKFDRVDGLQENNMMMVRLNRSPYLLYEPWCAAPPSIPNCVANNNSADDMKKQIKFWVRALASHVRQEC